MVPEMGAGTKKGSEAEMVELPATLAPGGLRAQKILPGMELEEVGSERKGALPMYGC